MVTRKASSGIETKEVLSAVVLADSFTQVGSLSWNLQGPVNCAPFNAIRLHYFAQFQPVREWITTALSSVISQLQIVNSVERRDSVQLLLSGQKYCCRWSMCHFLRTHWSGW